MKIIRVTLGVLLAAGILTLGPAPQSDASKVTLAPGHTSLELTANAVSVRGYHPRPSHAIRHLAKGHYMHGTSADGSHWTATACYPIQHGKDATLAYAWMVKTGDYRGDMSGYVGQEDSDLVDAALFAHDTLTGKHHPQHSDLTVPVCVVK